MRIYLISPSHYLPDGKLVKSVRYWTSAVTLPYLKALTPPGHEVRFADELMTDVDLEADCDLVGLTAMGPQIARAYDLADHFRRRGKQVVMGGSWVSLSPDEAQQHADAVVVGEAESLWAGLLADAEGGRLRPRYQASGWHDLANLPRIDYSTLPLLDRRAFQRSAFYRWYFHWPVWASRGCPHPCEFCAVQSYYRRTFRTRPLDEVLEDFRAVRALGGRRVLILDDNPIGDPDFAARLFEALIPLRMQWASQCTINIARRPRLLDLAARSGCRTLTIGLETTNPEALAAAGKHFNQPERYAADLAAIRRRGIQVIALLMVGMDGDEETSFGRMSRFLDENHVAFLKVFTPCPFPGTRYHADLEAAGRILTRDWNRYDYGSAIVQPLGMTPEAMIDGFHRLYHRFYSLPSIARRNWPPPPANRAEALFYAIANLKVRQFLRHNPYGFGTISGAHAAKTPLLRRLTAAARERLGGGATSTVKPRLRAGAAMIRAWLGGE